MTERLAPTGTTPDAARYEIRLRGHLEPRWAAWFDGMTVTPAGNSSVADA